MLDSAHEPVVIQRRPTNIQLWYKPREKPRTQTQTDSHYHCMMKKPMKKHAVNNEPRSRKRLELLRRALSGFRCLLGQQI